MADIDPFILAIPEDDLLDPPLPWFIEPKDDDPAPEFDRQIRFLAMAGKLCPEVDVLAVPNEGKGSDWERIRRWREGKRAGALDLVCSWQPTRPDDRGVFYAEFKNGKKMPTAAQRRRLNTYYRQGHGCGVYRTAETLLEHLRSAGAPFLSTARWAA